ncbi:MAG: hypothetical protein U1G07_14840 [Verrucomicrobiota bacterium]
MSTTHDGGAVERETQRELGYAAYVLHNERVSLGLVPELGAKVISLRNLRTGREWMWHPAGARRLFSNAVGDDFALSPLLGMDECLPTIAPCSFRGRNLPDHGEVWSVPWELDEADWTHGCLTTRVCLPVSPFAFERRIRLRNNEVQFDYRLSNTGKRAEPFLWAMHPLLRLEASDHLILPADIRKGLPGPEWAGPILAAVSPGSCAKLFLAASCLGTAAVRNPATGDSLQFAWAPSQNGSLGIWLTRGGWHGHEHFAIEPTNGQPDALAEAIVRKQCGLVEPGSPVSWHVTLTVGDLR